MEQKYYLYARKSTDVEDKQVLSIEAQLAELREYAKKENLNISAEFVEKQSAKAPGRPVFAKMLADIEHFGGNILVWHPDRLARNSVDGGQILYLLDRAKIQTLKFPSFWFENTSQGKFMLSIAFGQSKYYVDNLAENTKRGLRQKVRRGEYPGIAPVGYMNDMRSKTIVVDRRRAPIVRQAFEMYAKNDSKYEDISNFLAQHKILTSGGKQLKKDQISILLRNPFYYGHFRYWGEVHEGKHTPLISKKLFDDVQEVLRLRGRPVIKTNKMPTPFCGLLKCGNCNMGITAERQKGHVYYRCTKKHGNCSEPYIRQEELDSQLSEILRSVAMNDTWANSLNKMLSVDEQQSAKSVGVFIRESKSKIQSLQSKLQRLLDGYLDQDIEREVYVAKKAQLMSEKKSLEEQSARLEQTQTGWLEPMKQWIDEASGLCNLANSDDLAEKKPNFIKSLARTSFFPTKKRTCSALNPKISPLKTIGWRSASAFKILLKFSKVSFWRVVGDSNPGHPA